MSHYKSNRRDIEFNLFEYLKVGEYYGKEPFTSFDEEDGTCSASRRISAGSVLPTHFDGRRARCSSVRTLQRSSTRLVGSWLV
jgi:hypothetical protein